MGARRNFSRGGQNHRHVKKLTRFRRAVQKIDLFRRAEGANENVCVFSRRIRLKYRVSIASAEGASENFKVFCRTAAYDVIFSNSMGGGGNCPKLTPPSGRLCTWYRDRPGIFISCLTTAYDVIFKVWKCKWTYLLSPRGWSCCHSSCLQRYCFRSFSLLLLSLQTSLS